jgi:hypothetical protein
MTTSRLLLITLPLKHVNQGFKGSLISNSRDVVLSFDKVEFCYYFDQVKFCYCFVSSAGYFSAITDYTTLKARQSRLRLGQLEPQTGLPT